MKVLLNEKLEFFNAKVPNAEILPIIVFQSVNLMNWRCENFLKRNLNELDKYVRLNTAIVSRNVIWNINLETLLMIKYIVVKFYKKLNLKSMSAIRNFF